jgi:hypothetical protein
MEITFTRGKIQIIRELLFAFTCFTKSYGQKKPFQIVVPSDHIAERNASDWILQKMIITIFQLQKSPYLYPACFFFVPLTKNNKLTFLLHGFLNIIGIMLKLPVLL